MHYEAKLIYTFCKIDIHRYPSTMKRIVSTILPLLLKIYAIFIQCIMNNLSIAYNHLDTESSFSNFTSVTSGMLNKTAAV